MAQLERLDGNKAKLTIKVEAPVFANALREAYKKNVNRYTVQGFRKGKAPRKVIENCYGEAVFYEDAFELCWGEAYDAALEEHTLFAVDRPDIDILTISEADGIEFTATVQLKPEATLGQYKGVVVPAMDVTVTDEDVEKVLNDEREKQARFSDVDREAQEGDRLLLDYSGSVDGEKFGGGTAEDQTLVLGSHAFIPGFEEQLIGVKAGEQRDITVTFPEEYHANELAGKEAVFACNIKAVQVKELPEIDDDFIGDISEFETLEAWKADKKAKLEEDKKNYAKTMRENNALKTACDNATVEIPDCMIERQIDYMLRDLQYRLNGSGLDLNTYCQYVGTTPEALRDTYREEAAVRVKMQLVIDAVVAAEGIAATDEDVEKITVRYAEESGIELETFRNQLSDDDREYLADRAAVEKAVALITESAVEEAVEA